VQAGHVAMVRSKNRRAEYSLAAALLLPNLALLFWFTYRPLVESLRLSLYRWDLISPTKLWVGLENYTEWWRDPVGRKTVLNTVVFSVVTVAGSAIGGLLFAFAFLKPRRGSVAARSALFSPYLIPGSAVGIVWYFIFDPRFGLLAAGLRQIGVRSPNWYNHPGWAMVMVCFVYIWKQLGYVCVLFMAGLQAIPPELFEAASLDGAGWWSRLRNIALPSLRSTSSFVLATTFIASMQAFDVISVMTQGGPLDGTRTMSFQIFDEAFVRFRVGRASAIAAVLFFVLLVVTVLQVRILGRKEDRS
jgi:sn-glycerol 3-phosphate transport system permease protein